MPNTRSGQPSSSPKTPKGSETPESSQNGKPKTPQDTSSSVKKRTGANISASEPAKKRGRPSKKLEQKTIEDTMDGVENDDDAEAEINGDDKSEDKTEDKDEETSAKTSNGLKNGEKNAFDEVKSDASDVKHAAQEEQDKKAAQINNNNSSIVEDSARREAIPSSILEKGIIYFMMRPRVRVEDPQSIDDVARSHIVLRPVPLGAKLGDGPLEDLGNARLIAVPKKMLPVSGKDRFLSFVENLGSTIKELRDMFQGAEYSTKTTGTSNQPAERPFAEGVYALTMTGNESHLAYVITVPSSIGEIQSEMGLAQKGSFITSVKNPSAPGPSYATLNNSAEYPESIMNKFRGRRWMSLEPEVLSYQHTQILLIGEGHGDIDKAMQEQGQDKKDDTKDAPEEEMDQLEEEDHDRVKHLDESDPVFADLGLSAKEFEKIQSSW